MLKLWIETAPEYRERKSERMEIISLLLGVPLSEVWGRREPEIGAASCRHEAEAMLISALWLGWRWSPAASRHFPFASAKFNDRDTAPYWLSDGWEGPAWLFCVCVAVGSAFAQSLVPGRGGIFGHDSHHQTRYRAHVETTQKFSSSPFHHRSWKSRQARCEKRLSIYTCR